MNLEKQLDDLIQFRSGASVIIEMVQGEIAHFNPRLLLDAIEKALSEGVDKIWYKASGKTFEGVKEYWEGYILYRHETEAEHKERVRAILEAKLKTLQ